jgi:type II secretory pathway pseudopilin PulG
MNFSKQTNLGVKKMKPIIKKSNNKAAFTIVELLTVMSIIVILIGLLVPALNKVKQFAREVKQKAQFHSIGAALELFNTQFDTLPDSSEFGPDTKPYCGAMKLAEAMVGKDLMGFHPDSVFNSSGKDLSGKWLYDPATLDPSARKGPFLPTGNANAYRIEDIYSDYTTGVSNGGFLAGSIVLCDVFGQVTNKTTGQKIGMPILYYKSHPSKMKHVVTEPDNSIYNYMDNQDLVMLGEPWDQTIKSRLGRERPADGFADGARFYENTRNDQLPNNVIRPFNEDTYLLISAGSDGEYGTSDDICNFDFKYRELQK